MRKIICTLDEKKDIKQRFGLCDVTLSHVLNFKFDFFRYAYIRNYLINIMGCIYYEKRDKDEGETEAM